MINQVSRDNLDFFYSILFKPVINLWFTCTHVFIIIMIYEPLVFTVICMYIVHLELNTLNNHIDKLDLKYTKKISI